MKGKLYLVSTPIGNYDDITLRALKILKEVDVLVCEEHKPARRMLSHYQIKREVIELNEHNEDEASEEILQYLTEGKSVALFSDGGTPLFSDPGNKLVDLCIGYRIQVIPVPGANSLLPALIGSGLDIERFYYYGWLSPNKDQRRKELLGLRNIKELIIFMETPYRLKKLLADVQKMLGGKKPAVLAYKLTMKEEKFIRGNIEYILKEVEKKSLKGEFVLLFDNR
jgi:16S rRNA (cytidine1402-2'-O)-methyltransferase